MGNYTIISGSAQLALMNDISILRQSVWPDFIRVPDARMFRLYEQFPDYQISVLDHNRELIAIANSIPLIWNKSLSQLANDGVDWVINHGLNEPYDVNQANVLCAISVTIADLYRNQGISKILLQHLKHFASVKTYSSLIIPVRPNLKKHYPLMPMDQYIAWKREDGTHFDPWLRTHLALGAEILQICHRSACVTADIHQWQLWTGMHFPSDGEYVFDGGLAAVEINHANNTGMYIEPNVWVHYQIL